MAALNALYSFYFLNIFFTNDLPLAFNKACVSMYADGSTIYTSATTAKMFAPGACEKTPGGTSGGVGVCVSALCIWNFQHMNICYKTRSDAVSLSSTLSQLLTL
jgi:hypothetical protein